jgi:hypothetical protein
MTEGGPFPSFYVADKDVPCLPGTPVRVDQSSTRVRIVEDPDGEYEVVNCRQATELDADPPMLRVNLRRLTGYRR